MDTRVILILFAEAVLTMALLYASGVLKKPAHVIVSALLVALAFLLRGLMLDYETLDYQDFLTVWTRYFAENGGFAALKDSIGNYNIPYLYFLAWFSYSDIRDLYLIKCLSIFFDIILAWSAMMLAGRFTKSAAKKLFCFFAVLFLPTVLLNGAYWGQCDSIYAAFAVMSIYLALSDRPWLAMAAAAVSFAFKLQAVFVLPVFAVLLILKRIKLRHFLMFPAAYIMAVLPAVLLGRPFWDTLTLYFNQAGSIGGGLNYNSSSVFSILTSADTALWSKLGVAVAFAGMAAVLVTVWIKRRSAGDAAVLLSAVVFSLMIPFLLPHMHDRYFFLADILTLVSACIFPALFALPVLSQFGSLLGYHAYLKMRYLLPMSYGGWAILAATVMAWLALFVLFDHKNNYRLRN